MSDTKDSSDHLKIANGFVEQANRLIESGDDPEAVGLAMTHAAANFTAFAAVMMEAARSSKTWPTNTAACSTPISTAEARPDGNRPVPPEAFFATAGTR